VDSKYKDILIKSITYAIIEAMQGRQNPEASDRKGYSSLPAVTGERSAVGPKSGESVCQSDPGLRRPTPPSTAGRKPAARPPVQFLPATNSKAVPSSREAGLPQPKIGRGAGQSPASQTQRAALGSFSRSAESSSVPPYALDDSQIAALIQFFQTLDRWDREAHGPQVM
jgi:hypothetical protein